MVTASYSNQQGSKPRQNPCQVQPTENIGNISASRWWWCIWLRTTVCTVSCAPQQTKSTINKVIRVCVCVFSSHPFWTSSSLDVPAGVTQEEGHTGFLIHLSSAVRALIFVARRIQPFLFPRRPWSRILCTNEFIVLHPLGIFILVF